MKRMLIGCLALLLVLPTGVNAEPNVDEEQSETRMEEKRDVEPEVVEEDKQVVEDEQSDMPIKDSQETIEDEIEENHTDVEQREKALEQEKVENDQANNDPSQTISVQSTNPIVGSRTTTPHRYNVGSTYWTTSNIREWLNSDERNVQYTNNPPSSQYLGNWAYDQEAGFLYEFTKDERDAIAVTQRRSFVHGNDGIHARDGGSINIPRNDAYQHKGAQGFFIQYASFWIHKEWKNVYYQTVNDKVFILSPHELYEYVQKRGVSYQKELTPQAKQKHNISNNYYSWMSTYIRSDRHNEQIIAVNETGQVIHSRLNSPFGVVPALHVKPDYVFSNGKQARNLNIGEKVTFGKYDGVPIEWMVINKLHDGTPLLWATKILTIKRFDAPGDDTFRDSISINFPNHDVSIKDDLQYYNGHSDTTEPTVRVINEQDLNTRQTEPWTLILEATDAESGLDYIVLPNGQKVFHNRVEFEITENEYYHFTAVDKAGNHYGYRVPVGNFDPPPTVIINTSANGWTNEDVEVNIFASTDDVGWTFNNHTQNTRTYFSPFWSDYTTYANKRIRISGKVKFVEAKADLKNIPAQMRISYDRRIKSGHDYNIARTYPIVQSVRLNEISDGRLHEFETIFTIHGDYFGNLRGLLQMDHTPQENGLYTVQWFDVEYELLDKEDFGIEKIILPNGEEIQSSTYTDVLSEDGVYTYRVLDSRGHITEKTVEVKIDKLKPTLSIHPSTEETTHEDVELTVQANDEGGSGVKRIQKPNGEWVNGDQTSYTIKENGKYNFIVEDHAGNRATQSITINNIDKTISFEQPHIANFDDFTLQDEPKTVSTTIDPVIIKDWRDGGNRWRLDVSASQMKLLNDKSFSLPKGTVRLKPVSNIVKLNGNGKLPIKELNKKRVIDNGSITIVKGDESRGEYEIVFEQNPLELVIDPTTAKIGNYETTITWELVNAP